MGKKEEIMQRGLSLKAIGILASVLIAVVGLLIAATRIMGSQDTTQAGHINKSYHDGAVPVETEQWKQIHANETDVDDLQKSGVQLAVMQRVLVSDVAELKSDVKEGFSKIEDLIRRQRGGDD